MKGSAGGKRSGTYAVRGRPVMLLGARCVDPCEQPQQRGLPAAVGALDPQQRTRRHVEVDVAQYPRATESIAAPDPP
ncbi:hypothetical protein GCM10020000_18040 [Streptomyces olivoverticillatus]